MIPFDIPRPDFSQIDALKEEVDNAWNSSSPSETGPNFTDREAALLPEVEPSDANPHQGLQERVIAAMKRIVEEFDRERISPSLSYQSVMTRGTTKLAFWQFSRLSPEEQAGVVAAVTFHFDRNELYHLDVSSLEHLIRGLSRYFVSGMHCPLSWQVIDALPPVEYSNLDVIRMRRFLARIAREQYGFLTAHGVELAKGGYTNFLNILLEGEIKKGEMGPLLSGNSQVYAGSHGPFFVVGNHPDCLQVYILPSDSYLKATRVALSLAVRDGILERHRAEMLSARLITVDQVQKVSKEAFKTNGAFEQAVIRFNGHHAT